MDFIELKNMKFYARHGVFEQEYKVGNTFSIDLKLFLDLTRAISSDDLRDTINYAEVYNLIKKEMDTPSHLLEHVAGRIIHQLKEAFPAIKKIEIRLAKKNPPMGADIDEVAIVITDNQ